MYEFDCGSPVCKTRFTAPTESELMGKVAQHVVVDHRVPNPTASLVQFVKDNCVREVGSSAKAG
jgi:hypothetical protein